PYGGFGWGAERRSINRPRDSRQSRIRKSIESKRNSVISGPACAKLPQNAPSLAIFSNRPSLRFARVVPCLWVKQSLAISLAKRRKGRRPREIRTEFPP